MNIRRKNTLVTTCLNEKINVQKWIADVKAQTLPPDEICIVDAGSSDGTAEILIEWAIDDPRVKVNIIPKCNVAVGRNKAIEISCGEIIISTDMGCRLDPCWFENLCNPFATNHEVEVVAGNYMVDKKTVKTAAARAACYVYNNYCAPLGGTFLPSSRSIAYLRRVWDELDGYPEDLTFAGDDTVFAMQIVKADYHIHQEKNAICYWGRHDSLKQYWKEAFIYSVGNGEAGICPPKYLSPGRDRYSRLLASFHALSRATLFSVKPILKALIRFDIAAVFLIPVLQYGSVMNRYSGYEIGAKRGNIQCRDTRSRLFLQ